MSEILVTENIQGPALDRLAGEIPTDRRPELWRQPQQLAAALATVRALLVRNQTQVTRELLDHAPRLQIVARAGVGLDNVDVPAASQRGIVVTSTPAANAVSVAELTIGLMLSLARQIPAAVADTRAGGWNRQRFTGGELAGKTLGVVGLGRIGVLTAVRARAFGMQIIAHDQCVPNDAPQVKELAARMVELDELLSASDIVSCHVPLTDDTRNLFHYDRFCQLRRSAFFINTSRGEVVDEAGLARALQEHRLAGAALDVRSQEPPGESPLQQFEQVLLTPHIAAFTREAQARVVETVCADIRAVLAGQPAENYVNFASPLRGT